MINRSNSVGGSPLWSRLINGIHGSILPLGLSQKQMFGLTSARDSTETLPQHQRSFLKKHPFLIFLAINARQRLLLCQASCLGPIWSIMGVSIILRCCDRSSNCANIFPFSSSAISPVPQNSLKSPKRTPFGRGTSWSLRWARLAFAGGSLRTGVGGSSPGCVGPPCSTWEDPREDSREDPREDPREDR